MEELPLKETPSWLKHLQDTSWEAEILISGGAIFGLFQLNDVLINTGDHLKEVSRLKGLNVSLLSLMIILKGITFGFVIHLLLRGWWISLVAISGIYPRGIDYSKLKITGSFLEDSKKTDVIARIIRLDGLSGLIFFGSFLFITILLGACFLFIGLGVISDSFGDYQWCLWLTNGITILGAIYWLDFILMGPLRKHRIIGKIYRPVYIFFNTITLGATYRPFVQIISTNVNRWKASLFLVVLFIASYGSAFFELRDILRVGNPFESHQYEATHDKTYAHGGLYLDQVPDDIRVARACIQSERIKDNYLRIFIPYRAVYSTYISDAKQNTFEDIVTIYLNDSICNNLQWFKSTRVPVEQLGIACYLPIIKVHNGKNDVAIKIAGLVYNNDSEKLVIPFWKE